MSETLCACPLGEGFNGCTGEAMLSLLADLRDLALIIGDVGSSFTGVVSTVVALASGMSAFAELIAG